MKIIRGVALAWGCGTLIVLAMFGSFESSLPDTVKLVRVLISIGIGVIASLLAIATKE